MNIKDISAKETDAMKKNKSIPITRDIAEGVAEGTAGHKFWPTCKKEKNGEWVISKSEESDKKKWGVLSGCRECSDCYQPYLTKVGMRCKALGIRLEPEPSFFGFPKCCPLEDVDESESK